MHELKRIRQERDLTQGQLAALSGIDRGTLNQVEKGRRSPNVDTLSKLAAALGVEVADFFPKAQPSLLDPVVKGPDQAVWGPDEERPNPAVEGRPGPGGKRIHVEVTDGGREDTRVTITTTTFLELVRQVEQGEISPEEALAQVKRIHAA